jgi:hypothetical protein
MTPSAPISMTEKQVRFERAVAKLILQCQIQDIDIICTRHISTLDEDLKYFLEGKSLIDPRVKPTMHMLRLAMDFAVIKDGQITWDAADYQRFGEIAESLGLRWGGLWASAGLNDCYHVEYQEGA